MRRNTYLLKVWINNNYSTIERWDDSGARLSDKKTTGDANPRRGTPVDN